MVSLGAVIAVVGAMNVVDVFLVRGTLGASGATYGLPEPIWTLSTLVGTWLLVRLAAGPRWPAWLLAPAGPPGRWSGRSNGSGGGCC